MRYQQLVLFPRPPKPPPGPLLHRWVWRSFWPSECSRCYRLWPDGAPVWEMTHEVCPGPALDMGFNDYSDVYLIWLDG